MRANRLKLVICLLLIVATIAVFWQVYNHDFVNYDDNLYVTENRHVQAGLTWEGIIWAFTTTHASNWHPLTWLSHMLDCQLFGLNAGGHHLTNLLFHIANTLLLFLVFNRMTGAIWRSAFVAALFALHPLHVESVAWVAERKDVLSTFFWMLTMWAYARYAERPGIKIYLLVFLFFALGLMAKPMLVTLPFVLLLMDYWPLGRLQLGQSIKESTLKIQALPILRLVWEKVPLFVLTAVSSVVTYCAQQAGGSVESLLPFQMRVGNALAAYINYIGKTIWPLHLAVFYPHVRVVPIWLAGLLLMCISFFVIRVGRRSPYLSVGWLWYLGTLVPVIGLVQVGGQAMADRYTYVPIIGLFTIIVWGVAELVAKWRCQKFVLSISVGVVLLGLAMGTWLQLTHWHNSVTLFKHTLDVTPNNYLAHNNLGVALSEQGRIEEAMKQYRKVVEINPNYAMAYYNLGLALGQQGRFEETIGYFVKALQIKPNYAEAYYNMGVSLGKMGNYPEELKAYKRAINVKPDYAEAYCNLGAAYAGMGLYSEAIWAFKEAIQLNPGNRVAQHNLKIVYEKIKNLKPGRIK